MRIERSIRWSAPAVVVALAVVAAPAGRAPAAPPAPAPAPATPRAAGVQPALAPAFAAPAAAAVAPESARVAIPAPVDPPGGRAPEPSPPPAGSLALRELPAIGDGESDPLAEPAGVLADAFGRVWVSDASHHRLRRWTAAGAPLDETGALGSEPGRFRRPDALARLGSLGVAVLDLENRRVVTYDHHLRLLGVLVDLVAPDLEQRLGRVLPVGLASDRGGALYVADAERDRVLVFDFAGTFVRELGGFSARAGGFSGLLGVACGPRGGLVTVERPRARPRGRAADDTTAGRARLQWLDAGGQVLAARWSPAWRAGSAEARLAIAVDDSGRVAVAGERSGELCVLSPQGRVLARLGGLAAPRALAFAPDGTLLVAEAGARRVRRLALERAAGE